MVCVQPVGNDGQSNGDIAVDIAHAIDIPRQCAVVGCEGDVEEGCAELAVGLARVQRGGDDHVLGGGEGEERHA